MQVQPDNSSEEDLSKYKKRGYEYVEEEKVVLDDLVGLYRKRLEIAQNYLRTLEELHSTAKTGFDSTSTLYAPLVSPILDCIQRDIEGYQKYTQSIEGDLAKIAFLPGPYSVVQEIKQDTEAAKVLHSMYEDSCLKVSWLPAPSPSLLNGWKIHEQDIQHRQITARLRLKQKIAHTHFQSTYPKLLDDHMEYMEQIGKLARSHTNRRSELSATIACNATAEKERLEKFSTVDAIAVPHLKLDLEKDRREYRHVPLLNVSTREMEEDRTVILGGDIELNDLAHEVITTCLKRCLELRWSNVNVGWEHYWDIIRAMELDPSEENVQNTIFKLQNAYEIGCLIDIIMLNTRMPHPLLTIVDEDSMTKLKANKWDRAALVRVMKDVDPRMEGLLTACAIAWITASLSSAVIRTILWTKNGSVRSDFAWEAILRMWDFELWRPLPDDVEWSEAKRNGVECICRKKRFQAKPEYKVRGYNYKWVWLDVDENGETLDTPENQEWKEWIREEQTEEEQVEEDQVEKESRSPFIRFLRKLNL